MKILIASDFYKPTINGVVTSMINLKSGLERLGHEVRVLTLSSRTESYMEDGVYYVASLDVSKIYPGCRFTIGHAGNKAFDIMEWKPDIIHTQNEFSTFFIAKQIARKLKIPVVHTYHTVYGDYVHYFFRSKKMGRKTVVHCTKNLGKSVTCIVAPTHKIANLLEEYGVVCPVHIFPTGISVEKFYAKVEDEEIIRIKNYLSIPENHTVLLSVSRIGKEKNIDELITYMKKLKERKITLVIVGDGPERKNLIKLVEKYGLIDIVKFTGMVSPKTIPTYYQMADLFVSASTSEAQGLTYIEALAAGTPILCKQDECLEGVLEEKNNGYAFANEDEFFEKLELYLQSNEKEQLCINAKNTATKFSKETFVNNLAGLYQVYCNK